MEWLKENGVVIIFLIVLVAFTVYGLVYVVPDVPVE